MKRTDGEKEWYEGKVRYWIMYRLPGGRMKKEFVGFSLEEARDADGKRRGQKRENRIFEILPESKITFQELTDWYLTLKSVNRLSSIRRVEDCLQNFNKVFGGYPVGTLKPENLENYQEGREEQGAAAATIDMELSIAQTMVNKGFDNDKVDGRALKAFRRVKRRLKKGTNASKRTLTVEEYLRLLKEAPPHLKSILTVAMNTGMRHGELIALQWSHIDRKKGFIRLPAESTKEEKPKSIPMNRHVNEALEALVRHVHHDYVFSYHGNPITYGIIGSLKTASKEAKVAYGINKAGGFRFHDIRATVKTNMLKAGIDRDVRNVILGHSLKGMDAYYLRLDDETLREAMDRYTQWLDRQIEGASENVPQTVPQVAKIGYDAACN